MVAESNAKKDQKTCSIVLIGDIMPGGEYPAFKAKHGLDWEYPFQNMRPLIAGADIVFANLECPLSKSGAPRNDKEMALDAPPESVAVLKYLGCNAVSLANNHISDYGTEGLLETINILNRHAIPHFGAGPDLATAQKPLIVEKSSVRVAFLGYTTDESSVKSIIATDHSAGGAPDDMRDMKRAIAAVKTEVDIICVSLHWGRDHVYPAPAQVELAHHLIDAGADVIIGHHPHLVQGWERYRDGVIFYSLGNFFFPKFFYKDGRLSRWSSRNDHFILARLDFDQNHRIVSVEVSPGYRNSDQQIVMLTGEVQQRFALYLNELSAALTRSDYPEFWTKYASDFSRRKISRFLMAPFKMGLKNTVLRLFKIGTWRAALRTLKELFRP